MENPKLYYKNTYHHIYNRVVNKGLIFFEQSDYNFFIKKLKEYKRKYLIEILCYCLLPNHFHLFAEQTSDDYTIGKFVGDLTNSFTKGINKKYSRSGVLFQGKNKSKLILDESYFIWLRKYILNNPVNAGLVKEPELWPYSSAKEYFNIHQADLTKTTEILGRFNSVIEFKLFIKDLEAKFDYSKLF
jgi:REP element-mobilizing transposase RayT